MVIMNILRMLVDVSFFGAFAGLVAVKFGGTGAFWGMLIQCLCFGLSYLGRDKRVLRMLSLLPICLGWVIHRGSLADCILMIPSAAYVIWLVWKNDYALDQDRQRRLFDVFWKVLLVFTLVALLLGGAKVVSAVTVPYALVMLIGSVLLLRALRHDPKIYCQKKYQLVNISAVVAVIVAAGLFSSKTFLNACAAVWKAFFGYVIQPIMEFLLDILLLVIWGITKLFSVFSFGEKKVETEETPQMDLTGMEEILGEDIQMKDPSETLRILGIILLVAAVILLLVLFFRWLNKRDGYAAAQNMTEDEREVLSVSRRQTKKRETSPVRKIRAQYRSFLKWCAGLGIRPERSSTSLDVHRQVDVISEHGAASEQIRELYIKARYAEAADPDGVRKMKELCNEVKKAEKK